MTFDRSLLATMSSCEDEEPKVMEVAGTTVPNMSAQENDLISFPVTKQCS